MIDEILLIAPNHKTVLFYRTKMDNRELLTQAEKDNLKKFGVLARFGEPTFYATIGEAVEAYLAAHSVEWVDWQERSP